MWWTKQTRLRPSRVNITNVSTARAPTQSMSSSPWPSPVSIPPDKILSADCGQIYRGSCPEQNNKLISPGVVTEDLDWRCK